MAILTSTNLLASHTLYTLVLAYLLLTAPQTLVRQNLVFTLGSSLRLPRASPTSVLPPGLQQAGGSPSSAIRSTLSALSVEELVPDPFATPNSATAFAALLLAFYALNDAVGTSLPQPCFGVYWAAQAIARLVVLFGLEAWIFLSKPAFAPPGATGKTVIGSSWTAGLTNDVVFTWAFLELVWTFWIFYVLRDETRREAALVEEKRKREEERAYR